LDSGCSIGYFTHILFVFEEIPELEKLDFINNDFFKLYISVEEFYSNQSYFVRELLLVQDIDRKLREIQNINEKFIIWCAGSRTKFMLEKTYLRQMNISFIVDSDHRSTASHLEGFEIRAPADAHAFNGGIIICHATNPFAIEASISKGTQFLSKDIYII
jgi:hypothetical protein